MKRLCQFSFCLVTVILILVSCKKSEDPPQPPAASKGDIEIKLTDAPGYYTSFKVNLQALDYNTSPDPAITTGWKSLPVSNAGVIDLVSLQNGTTSGLSKTEIDPAAIKQLRLKFGATGNKITYKGTEYSLIVSTTLQDNGIVIPADFNLEAGKSLVLAIDFNVANSVLQVGTNFTLQPDLRSFDMNTTGAIDGTITASAAQSIIQVSSSTSLLKAFTYPGLNGYFKIIGLPAGTYQLDIIPTGSFQGRTITGISVGQGQTRAMGSLNLTTINYDAADLFVGNWFVAESVTKNGDPSFLLTASFAGTIAKKNDSTFVTIQTRVPSPEWVGTGGPAGGAADSLWFIPLSATRTLRNTYQGNIGTYSVNKDTLNYTYWFGPPAPTAAYIVTQKWVRQ